jgi:hypothetical protein
VYMPGRFPTSARNSRSLNAVTSNKGTAFHAWSVCGTLAPGADSAPTHAAPAGKACPQPLMPPPRDVPVSLPGHIRYVSR